MTLPRSPLRSCDPARAGRGRGSASDRRIRIAAALALLAAGFGAWVWFGGDPRVDGPPQAVRPPALPGTAVTDRDPTGGGTATPLARRADVGSSSPLATTALRGQVVDRSTGIGIEGATVRVSREFAPQQTFRIETGPDGQFSLFADVIAGAFEVRAIGHRTRTTAHEAAAEASGGDWQDRDHIASVELTLPATDPVRLEIPWDPRRVEGRVQTADGQPVEGAEILLIHEYGERALGRSGPTGEFVVRPGPEPIATFELAVSGPADFEAARVTGLDFDSPGVTVTLHELRSIPLVVTDASGRRVHAFRVRARSASLVSDDVVPARRPTPPASATAPHRITRVASGETLVQVLPDDPLLADSAVLVTDVSTLSADAPLRITLEALQPHRVRILGPRRAPIAGLEVELIHARSRQLTAARNTLDPAQRTLQEIRGMPAFVSRVVARGVTDAQGNVTLGMPPSPRFLFLRIDTGRPPAAALIHPIPDPRVGWTEIALERTPKRVSATARVSGSIKGEIPVGCSVQARRHHVNANHSPELALDADRHYAVEDLPSGSMFLSAHVLGQNGQSIARFESPGIRLQAGGEYELDLQLPELGVLEGRVTIEGRPATGSLGIYAGYPRSSERAAHVRLDADGRYETPRLLPGQYRARLEPGPDHPDGWWDQNPTPIQLTPGATVTANFEFAPRSVTITFGNLQGVDLPQRVLGSVDGMHQRVEIQTSGTVRFDRIPQRGAIVLWHPVGESLEIGRVMLDAEQAPHRVVRMDWPDAAEIEAVRAKRDRRKLLLNAPR